MVGLPKPGSLPYRLLELVVAEPGDLSVRECAEMLAADPRELGRIAGRLSEAGYLAPRRYRLFPGNDRISPAIASPRQVAIVRVLVEKGPIKRGPLAEFTGGLDSSGKIQGSFKAELAELYQWGTVSPARCLWPSEEGRAVLKGAEDAA